MPSSWTVEANGRTISVRKRVSRCCSAKTIAPSGRRSVLDLGLAKIFSQGIGYITGGHRHGIKVI